MLTDLSMNNKKILSRMNNLLEEVANLIEQIKVLNDHSSADPEPKAPSKTKTPSIEKFGYPSLYERGISDII
jgi:hypothetical protein